VYYVLNTVSSIGEEKSALPSSGADFYYASYTAPLGVADMYHLPSGDEVVKSSTAVAHALIPTLGDVIELIPFLPIEINIHNVISSMMNVFNWMVNRRPHDQTTPRIHFLLKKFPWFRNVFVQHEGSTVSVGYRNQHSHGAIIGRLLNPGYRTHTE
jgi:hypothetical protein